MRLMLLLMHLAREPKKLIAVLVITALVFAGVAIFGRSDATGFYNSFAGEYRTLDDIRNNTLLPAWDPKSPATAKAALTSARTELNKAVAGWKELYEPSDREAVALYRSYLKYLNDYEAMLGKLDAFVDRAGNTASYSEWAKLVGKNNINPLDDFDRIRESFAKKHGLD